MLLFFLLFSSGWVDAQEEKPRSKMAFSGYGGGMMLHAGYVQGKTFTLCDSDGNPMYDKRLRGCAYGIGGAVKVGFGRHLRIGCEGYVTKMRNDRFGGFTSIGWGGILADCSWTLGKWTLFVGGTVGGGGVRSLLMLADAPGDFLVEDHTASYRHYTFMAITPFLGVEWAVLQRIHLTLKADWLFNVTNPQPDFVSGARIYFGIMFCHWKS